MPTPHTWAVACVGLAHVGPASSTGGHAVIGLAGVGVGRAGGGGSDQGTA